MTHHEEKVEKMTALIDQIEELFLMYWPDSAAFVDFTEFVIQFKKECK